MFVSNHRHHVTISTNMLVKTMVRRLEGNIGKCLGGGGGGASQLEEDVERSIHGKSLFR
jgi:hypothetical protein